MTVKFPQLLYEAKILRLLQGNEGIPILFWAGQEGEFNVMVLELLGPSLEDLFIHCGRKLTLKTTLLLAKQMISRVEYFHSRQFIHRDIKPDNFLMGMGSKSDKVYIIDYGLAKRYIDPKSGQHIPFKEGKALTGTARYTSLNNHLGYEQSRRDDLEGLAYVLIYLVRGTLPWMGIGGNSKIDKYQAIMEMKRDLPYRYVSQELPIEFEDLLRYCRALKFTDRPDYSYLKKMFDSVFYRANFIDYQYDWKMLHSNNVLNLQRNLESQFLASEALARRKRHGDKYDLKFPPIKPDPKAIAENLKNGILKREYNYEDPDNDDDFSRGGRKKYNDDDEEVEEDYDEDEEAEEDNGDDDEDMEEDDHDKLYPTKQNEKQKPQHHYNPQAANKPNINNNKQPAAATKDKQHADDNDGEYDDEDAEDAEEYDDEEDDYDMNKSGARTNQSRARDRLRQHLNNSQVNSVISNTVMRDLKKKIDKKAIENNPAALAYNDLGGGKQGGQKNKPKSMRQSARQGRNNLNAPHKDNNRSLGASRQGKYLVEDDEEEEEKRIKIKDLTKQINQGIRDMNKGQFDSVKNPKQDPKRSGTPLRLQPIVRQDLLPDWQQQQPQRQPTKNLAQPINLANNKPQQQMQQQQQQPAPAKSNNNSMKNTAKRGGGNTKNSKDSLRLYELHEDYEEEEELEEDVEEEADEEHDEEHAKTQTKQRLNHNNKGSSGNNQQQQHNR